MTAAIKYDTVRHAGLTSTSRPAIAAADPDEGHGADGQPVDHRPAHAQRVVLRDQLLGPVATVAVPERRSIADARVHELAAMPSDRRR